MREHHPILKTQVEEHIGHALPDTASLRSFLASVSETYWCLHPHPPSPQPPIDAVLGDGIYRAIFESSGTAMAIINEEAILVLANDAFAHVTGYSRRELEKRKSLAEFFSPRDFEHILSLKKHRRNDRNPSSHNCETTLEDRYGAPHHIFLCLSPIPHTRLFIATFTDISERIKAEEEIQQQRTELKRMNDKLHALYDVSAVTARSLDLHTLLTAALFSVTNIEILNLERKGMIYVLDAGHVHLVAHIGIPEDVVAIHRTIDAETALCMSAAHGRQKPDQVLYCNNPQFDCAFAAQKAGHVKIQPHFIAQLRSHNATTGVMCLYPKSPVQLDRETRGMIHTISNQIGIAIENAQLYEKMKLLSLHDPLTGLPNRRFLDLEIERNFSKAKRYETPLALLILDIDCFKKFNDSHGHTAGDSLLVDIAAIMLREIRESDLAVRYGGEEFIALLPETTFQQAFDVAERIRQTIAAKTPVTVSIGVSSFSSEMNDCKDIINDSDRALYQAKAFGKNRVEGISRQLRLPHLE